MDQDHVNTIAHWLGSAASVGAIIGALTGALPALAALIAFIWYLIQIYESETFKAWRMKRRKQKIARLEAQLAAFRSTLAGSSSAPSEREV